MHQRLQTPDLPVTVAVPVKNEEANLARCLAQLGRFAEVVVLDSDSSDSTQEIAASFGARIINFKWDGRYPKKRNWFLINHAPDQDWVLFLDADEIVDDAFCEAISEAVKSEKYNGYWLNYTNYFLGRRLRHGLPQRKLAFFRVGTALYERIEENRWSALDMEIHEHPIVSGPVGEITTEIEHNDDRGIVKFIERHVDYAKWEAERYRQMKGNISNKREGLTRRQRIKYNNISRWWYPIFYFLYSYILRLGFLDGHAGFSYAVYKFWYFYTIHIFIQRED